VRDIDRCRYDKLMADRELIDQAAVMLRREARNDEYAGVMHRPEVVFGVASLFDELARQLDRVSPGVRDEAVRAARQLLGLPAV
jgi:hypothetical protein